VIVVNSASFVDRSKAEHIAFQDQTTANLNPFVSIHSSSEPYCMIANMAERSVGTLSHDVQDIPLRQSSHSIKTPSVT